MNRREFLAIAGGSLLAGCAKVASEVAPAPIAAELPSGDTKPELRLLNRLGFGPRPGDLAAVRKAGQASFVASQLAADEPEDARLTLLLGRLDILRMNGEELRDLPREEVIRQLQQADLLRAVYGRNQLQERLTDFWLNHFNINALKADGAYRLAKDTADVVRKNALGSFPAMLQASAQSAAMLDYLDNTQNRRGVANENYARELLELHTLGVDGGYTQRDVQELARCFTGWTVENRFLHARGTFRFDPDLHDDGAKRVLDYSIPGNGLQEGKDVLAILANHPSTARHLSTKLCEEFLGREDPAWIERMGAQYLGSGGNITATLRPLLESNDLLDAPPIPKRPLDYVASALRALDADTDCGRPVLESLSAMGQAPYMWPMPDGYPNRAVSWSGSMLGRWNFAADLMAGRIGGTVPRAGEPTHPIELVHGRQPNPSEPLAKALAGLPHPDAVALCLASPEFQWR